MKAIHASYEPVGGINELIASSNKSGTVHRLRPDSAS
jgi:hypothetical protein